ncbi:hypothetical protein BD309DRAFT_1083246 [Dichomitus squalens]|uniref:non-specific serine/threonine protein kinase n=1 Tax=Dichomitus squalens TaxID=114155 RepID=A0A4Q9NH19_9APHY|nr:hypothetical protein BD309DRAFT_1083246 [Dichomitus squalens]TBU63134.1 hypothetical protein BD310DRAFT_964890 [Dichomitus squalens]
MLGSRTKHVFSYGRRGRRVVNAYDDYDRKHQDADSASSRRENDVPRPHVMSEKGTKESPISNKSKVSMQDSPPILKKKSKKSPKATKVGIATAKPKPKPSFRPPLGSIAPNAPGSPALPPSLRAMRRPTAAQASPLAPQSPVVSVDIIVLDAKGRRVSQEHRISRMDVQTNVLAPAPSKKAKMLPRCPKLGTGKKMSEPIVVTSDSEEDIPLARPKRNVQTKVKPIVISDSEEDSDSDFAPENETGDVDTSIEDVTLTTPRFRRRVHRARSNVIRSPSPTPSLSPSPPPALAKPQPAIKALAVAHPSVPITRNLTLPPQLTRPQTLAPFSSLPDFDEPEAGPSRSKPRKLTPIRARPGRALFPAPPSPPSPTTPSDFDADATFDFGQLALSPRALAQVQQLEAASLPPVPAYVQPLLAECAQTTPHEFSAFIEMFPFDPIVRLHDPQGRAAGAAGPPRFQKIGEASFSEVFGIGDVVLKIVPLRDEERHGDPVGGPNWAMDAEGPAPSDAKDVLKEIIVTRAMGACCSGFVELLRTYVVRGKYPSLLLDLWDEYAERKGSESVRPDPFTVSQLYAIIVLPNGGPDLEAYTFSTPTKTGWRQACSVFWQVTRTLAEAEDLVCFEHRDLHWGQILVKDAPPKSAPRRKTRVSMDDAGHGVLVTIIDLGLSRMDSHDAAGAGVHWTPFDAETFEGAGDYQFDVYRMMRAHNGDRWHEYRPLTNVMWLHYLVLKLLQSKRLRPPAASRKSTVAPSSGFSERECYECLKEVEGVLGLCLAGINAPQGTRKKGPGRTRKTQAPVKAVQEVLSPQSAGELLELAMARGWVS